MNYIFGYDSYFSSCCRSRIRTHWLMNVAQNQHCSPCKQNANVKTQFLYFWSLWDALDGSWTDELCCRKRPIYPPCLSSWRPQIYLVQFEPMANPIHLRSCRRQGCRCCFRGLCRDDLLLLFLLSISAYKSLFHSTFWSRKTTFGFKLNKTIQFLHDRRKFLGIADSGKCFSFFDFMQVGLFAFKVTLQVCKPLCFHYRHLL